MLDATHAMQSTKEAVENVYPLPSMKQAIRYFHAAAGFLTKDSWIKAIKIEIMQLGQE